MLATNLYISVIVVCMAPFGMSLTCHYCSNLYGPFEAQDCKNPINKTCDSMEDRCMSIKLEADMGFNDSKHQMALNCTKSAYCGQEKFCKELNSTAGKGLIRECKIKCCTDDFCNTVGMHEGTTDHVPPNATTPSTNTTIKPTTKGDVDSAAVWVQSVSGVAGLLVSVVAIIIY